MTSLPTPHPYPAYRPSAAPWLGDVPAHWEVRRLTTCISTIQSGAREQSDVGPNDGIPNLGGEHIGFDHQLKLENMRYVTREFFSKIRKGIIQEGDILLVKDGATIGKVTHIRRKPFKECSINEHVFIIRTQNTLLPAFLFQVLCTQGVQERIWQVVTGSAQPGLNVTFTKALPLPLPPLPEQRAIVRYLDYAGRRIRRYADAKRRLAALLEEERRAIVNRAVTRGLDPAAPLTPSGIEWLGDVPAHWEVRRLKGLVANAIEQTNERQEYEIYLALEHVESWTGKYASAGPDTAFESQVKRFRSGDVLFGKLRPYLAKVARPSEDGVCVGEFLVLRSDESSLTPTYLERFLRSTSVIHIINSSTFGAKMPRADWQFIGGLSLPLPPLPEQRAIVAYLDEATARIDAAITRARRQAELAEEYRDRLIADVVTGQLDVREAAAGLPEEAGEEAVDDGAPLGDEAGRREP